MVANTARTREVISNYSDLGTCSFNLQRNYEKMLAGYSLTEPIEVLACYEQIEGILEDEMVQGWLRYLWERKKNILAQEGKARTDYVYLLAQGYEQGKYLMKLIKWMNRTWLYFDPCAINKDGSITWKGYSVEEICGDLTDRIIRQRLLRQGLPDLADYVLEVLER